jgi:CheY-like chemotaxis protein
MPSTTMPPFEVVLYDPVSRLSRALRSPELEVLLELLSAFDQGVKTDAGRAREEFAPRFSALGLDVNWHLASQGPAALFEIRSGSKIRSGFRLKDLLEALKEFQQAEQTGALADPRTKSVMIIDDDDALRELFHFQVSREGFRADIFGNGREALEELGRLEHDRAPDLIIIDLMMPERGGYETIQELQTGDHARIPVIVVTGRFLDRDMENLLSHQSNVRSVLRKPVPFDQLAAELHRVLGTRPKVSP